jgi:Domain of unknown function (DUF4824)
MKNTSLAAGVAIILIANAFALVHAARNRTGNPEAEMTLTNRELVLYSTAISDKDEDSGVTLNLRWTTAEDYYPPIPGTAVPPLFNQQKLSQMGFDCSVSPASDKAVRFYQRQRGRPVFIALEYDGQAWRDLFEAYRRAAEQRAAAGVKEDPDFWRQKSHLVVIDADRDATALRNRYPNRSSVVIVPGTVRIFLAQQNPAQIDGRIEQIPSAIHVPRPFSDGFRNWNLEKKKQGDAGYSVRVRFGSALEPWVAAVQFGR